jgi:hypothetical protein
LEEIYYLLYVEGISQKDDEFRQKKHYVRFEVLTAASMKTAGDDYRPDDGGSKHL